MGSCVWECGRYRSKSVGRIDLKPRIWTFQIRCYRKPSIHKIETSTPKSFFFFWVLSRFSSPSHPIKSLRTHVKRQISERRKFNQKKWSGHLQKPTEETQKKFYRLNRGAGEPPWWFFRVNFFIRFLDVSPPNKNSQTNGFSPNFPTFFLCKKKPNRKKTK